MDTEEFNINNTGKWLINQMRDLIENAKSKGITVENQKRFREISGRMEHWKRELNTLTGDSWKNGG